MPGLHLSISFLFLPGLPILLVIPQEYATYKLLLPGQCTKPLYITPQEQTTRQVGLSPKYQDNLLPPNYILS